MVWVILLVLGASVAVIRIVGALRRQRLEKVDDWDEQQVKEFRARGGDAFAAYAVDFFFFLPDEAGCAAVRAPLEAEGFHIDQRPMGAERGGGFSLHARRSMRISVPDMQGYSRRFRTLAAQHGGQYDGWATSPAGA
jgi:hypothetical protein